MIGFLKRMTVIFLVILPATVVVDLIRNPAGFGSHNVSGDRIAAFVAVALCSAFVLACFKPRQSPI